MKNYYLEQTIKLFVPPCKIEMFGRNAKLIFVGANSVSSVKMLNFKEFCCTNLFGITSSLIHDTKVEQIIT